MARRKDIEGSVRPTPGSSGQWQARLPYRLDAHRRPLPGMFASEAAAWSALRAAIVGMDRNAQTPTLRAWDPDKSAIEICVGPLPLANSQIVRLR